MTKQKNVQYRKNFIWNIIGTSLNSFISLFYLIIVTRINGIEQAGIFSFAFALALISYTIGLFGGRIFQISDVKEQYSNNIYITSKIITAFGSLIILIIFCFLNLYNLEKFTLILILTLSKFFEVISDSMYGILQKNNRLDIVGKSLVIKSIVSLIAFLIIDILTKNILISSLGISLINMIILYFYDFKNTIFFNDFNFMFNKKIKKLLRDNIYIFLFNLLLILIINVPRYVVDLKLNDSVQGYFGIIIMIPTVMLLFGQFIIQPELIEMSELFHNHELAAFVKKNNKNMLLIVSVGIICILGIYFIGVPILNIIYGISFVKYKLLLIIVIIGGIFNALTSVISASLSIMRKTKPQFIIYLMVLLFGFCLSFYLCDIGGLYGVIYSFLIIMVLQFILLGLYFLKKLDSVQRSDFL